MSTEDQLQYPPTLESFENERARYHPIDLIDFSIEYFMALQNGTPLKYNDLSGLNKFILKPENEKIITRLQIPDEDLYRVILRRKPITQKEFLSKYHDELTQFNQIIDSSSNNELSEQEKHQYLKFKTKMFQEHEFLRFIDGIEKLPLRENDKRIYFTKYNILDENEKKASIDLLSLDFKIRKIMEIEQWKNSLIKQEKSSHHSYAPYDKVSYKLEGVCRNIDMGQEYDKIETEVLLKDYEYLMNEMKELNNESEIYNFFINKYQFIRVIAYSLIKVKSKSDESLKDLFNKVDTIFKESFAHLTTLDYYDFIVSSFIPLLKKVNPTSQEKREMESYLYYLFTYIPYILNTNFEEEKSLYYNIECVKYLLNKENRIKDLSFKKILIDLIDLFAKRVKNLKKELNLTNPMDIQIKFNDKLQLLLLQLNEFYPNLVSFTDKLIKTAIKYNMEENIEIRDTIISEFKGYEHIDQILITNSMKMKEMFETDEIKQRGIEVAIELLVKSLSIPEMNDAIINKKRNEKEIIEPLVQNYYNKMLNTPRYNFDNLKYIKFKHQNQIISLVIKNNKNLENTAKSYDLENIEPYIYYHNMIEEIFNFNKMFFKLKFDQSNENLLKKDGETLMNKFKNNFKKENEFIQSLPSKPDDKEYINKFKEFNCFQQKLILTYLNFSDNFTGENKYLDIIRTTSVIYLLPKVEYINKLILSEKDVLSNQIFFEGIYDDFRHVNYPIYIYIKYDHDINFFMTFTDEEKEIIKNIQQALLLKPNFENPKCHSFEELLSMDNLQEVEKDINDNHELMSEYIKLYNPFLEVEMLNEFSIFNSKERKIVMKLLEKKKGINISILKNFDNKTKDDEMFTLKKIVAAEIDDNLTKSNNEFGNDVKIYYRKKLLELEKGFPKNKLSFISNVLDNPYDPNYRYLFDNFNTFSMVDKISIIKIILSKIKIRDYSTLYYDELVVLIMEEIIRKYIEIAKRHYDSKIFMKKVMDEFIFLVRFYDNSVFKFIINIDSVENQTIYKFIHTFNDKERKIICKFLELYSLITNNPKYSEYQEDLSNYLDDLTYQERLDDIQYKLEKIYNNEIIKYMFIITSEEIKETAFEIDYIIEEIINNTNEYLNDFSKNLFKTLGKKEKNILILTLKCLKQQGNNGNIEKYIEELETIDEEKPSMFEEIMKFLDKKKEDFEQFIQFKNDLNAICFDLFEFIENCKRGKISVRKIKAIAPVKVELIKKLLDIEYKFKKDKNIKNSLDVLTKFRK